MRVVKAGTTSVSLTIRIIDDTDGTPETGVVWNTAGIALEYRREGALSTAITEATLAALTTAWSTGGFLHIGNGYYRLDIPDAALAAGVTGVLVHGTVTGMVVIGEYIQLVAYDPFDAVRLGLTALPNAAADAAGGLVISDAGGLDIDATDAAAVRLTAARAQAIDDWINGGRLDLLLDAIPTTAMRGTDSAALASVCTEVRLATCTDWINGGRLDLLLDAIPTTAMRGTDSAALASVCTEVRLAALTDWINGGRLDLLLDALIATVGTAGAGLSNITLANDLSATMKTSVQTAVDAAIDTAISELSVGIPAATPTLRTGLMLMYMALRNELDVTATLKSIKNNAGTTIATKTLSDDGTTYQETEAVSG